MVPTLFFCTLAIKYQKFKKKKSVVFGCLKNAKNRIHILDGLLIALSDIDKIISTIRNSDDTESATNNLIKVINNINF